MSNSSSKGTALITGASRASELSMQTVSQNGGTTSFSSHAARGHSKHWLCHGAACMNCRSTAVKFAASNSLYDDAPIHATRGHPTAGPTSKHGHARLEGGQSMALR